MIYRIRPSEKEHPIREKKPYRRAGADSVRRLYGYRADAIDIESLFELAKLTGTVKKKSGIGEKAKKVFQVIDHCTIYFLIAGTYTPMVLCGLMKTSPVWAWIIFSIVWGCAALATTLTAIDLKKYKAFSMICYIAMGWAILLSIKNMHLALGNAGFMLLLLGGIFYTGGVIFYKLGNNKRYFHSIFHLFTLVGSIAHALCVMFYVL